MSNNHDEDTEWNDILRAKGIIPQKEAQITEADIIDMIDEAILKRDAKNYDEKTVDELDELLDEGNEDEERMLMEYRYHPHPYTHIRPYSHYQPSKLTLRAYFLFLYSLNFRAQRLNAIKQELSEDKFGEIQHIYKTDFVREVSDASKDVWVVVYLYKE